MTLLYHYSSSDDNEIDEVVIVASRDEDRERIYAEVSDFLRGEPQLEGVYELVPQPGTGERYPAELRPFAG